MYGDKETVTCAVPECGQKFQPDYDDSHWSSVLGGLVCWPCWESALEHATIVLPLVGGSYSDEHPYQIFVTDLGTVDSWDEEPTKLQITTRWVPTDGWRGYAEVNVDQYESVSDGNLLLLYGRITNGSRLVDALKDAAQHHELPVDVLLVIAPTSNVFSRTVDVLVHVRDLTEYDEWWSIYQRHPMFDDF